MYYIYGVSVPFLLIESTDSMIHKDRTDTINDKSIAKQFIMENDRSFFGNM